MSIAPSAACLIITNNFPPRIGGAGEVYAALAASAGGRIVVLCATHSHVTRQEVAGWRRHDESVRYKVHRVRSIRPALSGGGVFRRLAEETVIRARLLTAVVSLHSQYRFHAVCIADDETVGWLMAPLRLLGCRVVLYTHGDDLAVRPGRLHRQRRRRFARADAIVAVSAASADELSRGFEVPRARVTVIPNGVDLDLFQPLPAEAALRDRLGLAGRRVFATVTRLVPRKGVDRVIAALPRVRAAVPDAHYLVVGDGPQLPELRDQAVRASVSDMISFVGAVPHRDVPRYLRVAELMVMPNRRMPDGEEDGFGLVFLEANACGLPVIAGRAGGVPEVVADGVNGLLVDGEDVDAIAAAIVRLLTDRTLAERLARNGLERARQAGWAARAAAFLDLCTNRPLAPVQRGRGSG